MSATPAPAESRITVDLAAIERAARAAGFASFAGALHGILHATAGGAWLALAQGRAPGPAVRAALARGLGVREGELFPRCEVAGG